MKKLFLLGLIVLNSQIFGSYIIPNDYEETSQFIKVTKEHNSYRNRIIFRYQLCRGDIQVHECESIFDSAGYSQSELNALETDQAVKGGVLLAAEVFTGGFIWKRLTKFAISGANKLVLKEVARNPKLMHYRGQDVATGIVSLGIALPVSTGGTVAILSKTNDVFEAIDPFDKFSRSELIDTDEYQDERALIPTNYDTYDTLRHLEDLLMDIH